MGSEFSDIIAVDQWLQQWWGRAGGIVTNYDDSTPEDPWAWDGWLAWGVVELPGTVGGESMQPLIELLQGIVALWDSRAETGPKRTRNELQNLSSRAWVTYNRLQTMIRKIQEAAGESGAGAGVAAVKTAAAAPEPAAPAALGGDQSTVSAKQLAAHAGCTDRVIREYLADCPAETVRSGAKIWRYGDVLAKLRQWCEDNRQERLQAVEWPDLAKNLKNKAAGTKKK